MEDQGLQTAQELEPVKPSKKVGFHNQANLKAMARGQILEALTANKGGKVGKRGLIYKILESIDRDMEADDPSIRRDARADALKLALSMTKDDKASDLSDLLKSGSNVQINFNSYFASREPGLRVAFTPPPDPGDAPPSE